MKPINAALAAHLASGCTTLCTLVKLTRRDGMVMGFTDHDRDIAFGGLTYEAAIGYERTAVASNSTLAVDDLQIMGVIDSAGLSEVDLRAGVYDHARIELAILNWADPAMGVLQASGHCLGQVQAADHGFTAEIVGVAQAFTRQIVRVYTPDCDCDLGDARCGVDLSLYTETGTVTAVAKPTRQFTADITGGRAAGFFDGGLLTWTSGANAAHPPLEVKSVVDGAVTLYLPTNFVIVVGDAFSLSAGCDKSITTCNAKFGNAVNFRGFPAIPGLDAAVSTPNAL